MTKTTLEIAQAAPAKAQVNIGPRGIQIADMDSLWRFSQAVQKSGLAPKGIESGEAIFVAIQMGLEVGLTPMAALQNIAVINGRPAIWGDAQLAVCRATGEIEVFEEWFEAAGKRLPRNPVTYTDDTVAVCRVKRSGYEPSESGFSVADAKKAGLWGKAGPWTQYPFRMLRMRARSFALRDTFGDALRGIASAEELSDAAPRGVNAGRKPATTLAAPKPELPEAVAEIVCPTATPDDIPLGEHSRAQPVAQEQAPEPPPGAAPTPKERLAAFLDQHGINFDDFRDWMINTGRATPAAGENWDSVETVDEAAIAAVDGAAWNKLRILYSTKK